MQSLLDPARLRPPPVALTPGNAGDTIISNTRMNLSLAVQLQQQQEQQFQQPDLEENEILSISQYHGETG